MLLQKLGVIVFQTAEGEGGTDRRGCLCNLTTSLNEFGPRGFVLGEETIVILGEFREVVRGFLQAHAGVRKFFILLGNLRLGLEIGEVMLAAHGVVHDVNQVGVSLAKLGTLRVGGKRLLISGGNLGGLRACHGRSADGKDFHLAVFTAERTNKGEIHGN